MGDAGLTSSRARGATPTRLCTPRYAECAKASYAHTVLWPNLRGLFAAGTVTDDWYIDEILCWHVPSVRFQFCRGRVLPTAAKSEQANRKLYELSFEGVSKPLFFCPVGPSATRPGMKERFLAQFHDSAALLRSVFCPEVQKSESPANKQI